MFAGQLASVFVIKLALHDFFFITAIVTVSSVTSLALNDKEVEDVSLHEEEVSLVKFETWLLSE